MAIQRKLTLTLWRLTWTHAWGMIWQAQRTCDDSTAEAWLVQFRHDDPDATYCLAYKAPRITAAQRKYIKSPEPVSSATNVALAALKFSN